MGKSNPATQYSNTPIAQLLKRVRGSGNTEHRTLNVEHRIAKPLTYGLGPIERSMLEFGRWMLKGDIGVMGSVQPNTPVGH